MNRPLHHLAAVSALIVGAAIIAPVPAHEAWAGQVILIQYGEPGAPGLDAYKPGQIGDLAAIAADGRPLAVTAQPLGQAAVVVRHDAATMPAAVFFTMRLGHYIITGDQWREAPAAEAASAATTWTGSYTVTSILAWHADLARPRDRSIELVPLADPLSLPAGAALPLRAFRQGKPLADLRIAAEGGRPAVVSDADGHLAVPVAAGHQVILGSLDETVGGRTTGHLAVLSFTRR